MAYKLPRSVYNILEEALGSQEKADKFAVAFEKALEEIDKKAEKLIVKKKEILKIELKEKLKNEPVTRDLFEERFKVINERFNSIDEKFKVVDEKFKRLELKLNILIILVLLALTLFNPTFFKYY